MRVACELTSLERPSSEMPGGVGRIAIPSYAPPGRIEVLISPGRLLAATGRNFFFLLLRRFGRLAVGGRRSGRRQPAAFQDLPRDFVQQRRVLAERLLGLLAALPPVLAVGDPRAA